MSASYIIKEISLVTGHRVQDDRDLLLSYANRAAKEIYDQQDLPGSLAEVVLRVLPDYQISLPSWIGKIRAMRQYTTTQKIVLNDMRPRYSYQGWSLKWDRWRLKDTSPLYTELTGVGPVTLTSFDVEDPAVEVTVTGKTANSNRVSEVITMDATSKAGTQSFSQIYSIDKSDYSTYDIGVLDSADTPVSVIPNDQLRSEYLIIDVSAYPNWVDNSSGELYMEVLYKNPLRKMISDGDEFNCPGYDDAIVFKALEFWFGMQKDGMATAVSYFTKAAQVVKNVSGDIEGPVQKAMTFAPNQYFGLTPRALWPTCRPWLLR